MIQNHMVGLVVGWFYGISTPAGYLMLNPVYTYIFDLDGLVNLYLLITFLNEPEFICLHTVDWF